MCLHGELVSLDCNAAVYALNLAVDNKSTTALGTLATAAKAVATTTMAAPITQEQ